MRVCGPFIIHDQLESRAGNVICLVKRWLAKEPNLILAVVLGYTKVLILVSKFLTAALAALSNNCHRIHYHMYYYRDRAAGRPSGSH